MLDEYLALGGVELGNNARAYDYASCLSCCAGLLKLPGCDGIHDATTDFTNATWQWQAFTQNRALNPSFEAAGAAVEVQRNLALNPNAVAATGFLSNNSATWTATKETVTATTHPQGIASRAKSVLNGAQTTPIILTMYNIDTLGNSNPARTVGAWLYVNAGGYQAQIGTGAVVPLTAGQWAWVTGPVAANSFAMATVSKITGNAGASDISYITGVTALVGGVVPQATIAGGTAFPTAANPDPDFTTAFVGSANASESTLSGVAAATVAGTTPNAAVVRSAFWASTGSRSIRIIPTTTVNSSYSTTVITGLTPGQSYTFLATAHLEAPQTGALAANARGMYTGYDTGIVAKAPNVAGDHPLQITVTATSASATVVFYNGSTTSDIWYDDFAVIASPYSGTFFDGSNLPEGADPDVWRVSWLGAANNSMSLLEQRVIIDPAESAEPPYSCDSIALAPWYDQSNPFSQDFAGFYLLSVKGITDGTMTAGVTESVGYGGVIGAPHYATRSVRVRSMLVGCGRAATHYGLSWLKAALGESFCSRHGDACGTSDLAFFIDCPPTLEPGEENYAAATAPYRRYLHDVACTSAPIIAEEYETMSGAYVVVVEYILTAESPFVWGQTFEAESTGAVLTAYDDIPFNLMRRPSGEQGDGIPAVVATQYAFNGSAEYGGSAAALPTGWARTATNISAGLTDAKSADIAAVGPNSARVRLLATGPVNAGTIRLYYDVALGTLPAGSAPSVSLWAAALTYAGSPVLAPINAEVEWRTASATVSTAPLGQIPVNGGNISAPGLTRPPTATIARLSVTLPVTSAIAGDDIRLYADAFGLTVP